MYDNATAIEAFSNRQGDTLPEARLVIAGSGPEEARLKSAGRDACSLATAFTFAGRVDTADMPGLYRSAHVALNPSLIDNMPNSVLEAQALAAGVPVVSTRVGGVPYIVGHGETALLVEPGAPAEMAAALLQLLTDPLLAKRLREAGLDTAQALYLGQSKTPAAQGIQRCVAVQGGVQRRVEAGCRNIMPLAVTHGLSCPQEAALGRPTFAYWQEFETSQWLGREQIEALQTRKLNALLASARAHSPWHARRLSEAGLDDAVTAGCVTLADLSRLPSMNKVDARDNVEQLVWRDAPGGVFKYSTGGSSGEPLIFYFGRTRQASDAAGRMRARRWWGVEPGEREAYLWGAPVELNKTDRIKTLRDRLVNQLVLNAFAMSPERMDEYLDALQAWQPMCLYGYASSVALLAAHAEARQRKLHLPTLRVVCTTGEPLYPAPARTHCAGIRCAGGERIRQPRHRFHRA